MRASLPRIALSMRSGVASAPSSSSIRMTSALAPPWSGPLSAPMPPTMAEWTSDSVAATTRAANVDAFSSWSACSVSAMSKASSRSRLRPLAGQHVEEVGGVASAGSGAIGPPPAAARPIAATRLASCPVRRTALRYVRLRRNCRRRPGRSAPSTDVSVRSSVHAVRGGSCLHQPDDRLGQGARRGELRLQVAQLGAGRQPAVPEEEAHLLERRVLRARSWMS